jgi:hypothetical protein
VSESPGIREDDVAASTTTIAEANLRAGNTTLRGYRNGEERRVSLFHYAPAFVLLVIVVADGAQFADPDLWGHIRAGQAILEQGHIILRDTYSYSAFGQLYRNHEWLTEVLMALIYNHGGVIGLKLWKFTCAALTFGFLAAGLSETGAGATVQLYTLMCAAVALMLEMQFRPQLFTYLLFAALLMILARHNYRGSARTWLIIPVMALWANLHGGFVIGIATLGTYTAVVGMQDLIAGKGLRRALRLVLITLAATLVTLATPWGINLWYEVIRPVFSPAIRTLIVDWHPLTLALAEQWRVSHFGVLFYLFVLGLMGCMAVSFALSPKGGDLPLVAIAAVMSLAAFSAARNIPLAAIALTLPVARHVSLVVGRLRERAAAQGVGFKAQPIRARVNQWMVGAVAIVLGISFGLFSPRLRTPDIYPTGAVAFMQRHGLAGNVLNDFNWGEYLIWRLTPASKVFIDGRYDTVYSITEINDYLLFYFDRPGGSRVLSAYPHDFVLIPPRSAAFRLMTNAAGWALVYRDENSALFARAGSPAANIPGIPVTGTKPANQYFP